MFTAAYFLFITVFLDATALSVAVFTDIISVFAAVFTDATSVFGCVEICVNTAGIANEDSWRLMLQVNLVSQWFKNMILFNLMIITDNVYQFKISAFIG